MTMIAPRAEPPRHKAKSFRYNTSLEWLENRSGIARSQGKPELRVASPPEFKGEAGVWTPEDLFVSAVESCTMATFLAFAQRKGLPLVAYHSNAEGVLELVDGKLKFTHVTIHPEITVATAADVEDAHHLIGDAERLCLVANSLETKVTVKASVSTR